MFDVMNPNYASNVLVVALMGGPLVGGLIACCVCALGEWLDNHR
jgi:hypothetical protein